MKRREPLKTLGITAAAALAVGAVVAVGAAQQPAPPTRAVVAPAAAAVPVLRVVDGDTFDVPEGRVRLLVADSCERGTAGGTRATAEARQLLEGQRVVLTGERDRDRDRYGRLLRYVELPDGRDFAEAMLAADHTAVYGGRSDASLARLESGRRADRDGRRC